jgi:hypothetical protein
MPDVRRHPTIAPILALILVAMLGNSGMACACALAALDTPTRPHHGMSGDHGVTGVGEEHDCGSSCKVDAASAPGKKVTDTADHRTDKLLPPAAYHNYATRDFAPDLPGRWQYEKNHPPLPLSTPVSRSDTLLD